MPQSSPCAGLRPAASEFVFLLACARAPYSTAAAQRAIGLLNGPLDWDRVLSLARSHGLVPNLNRACEMAGLDSIPSTMRAALQAEARATAARGRFLTGELFFLLDALHESGIPALPLKGPVLAQLLYADPGARQLADLDILVPRAAALRAVQIAVALGYRPVWDLSLQFFETVLRHNCELALVDSRTGHMLEIHWATQPGGGTEPIEIDRAFDFTMQVPVCGRPVPFFEPVTLCLFLCGHGAKHLWSPLKNLVDLARLLDIYPDLDWDQVFRRARQTGSTRLVLYALAMLQTLLHVELPDRLRRRMAAGPALSRARAVSLRILSENREATAWQQLAARFDLGERLSDRISIAFNSLLVVTPADWESLPGKQRPAWVYWCWRPVRLLSKYLSLSATWRKQIPTTNPIDRLRPRNSTSHPS